MGSEKCITNLQKILKHVCLFTFLKQVEVSLYLNKCQRQGHLNLKLTTKYVSM